LARSSPLIVRLYRSSAAERPNLFFKGEYHARFA
jgi:hypothetical protein